ncbi:MAG: chromosome segregation protein SMC [Candidatus Nanoarchaeia archaeon]
MTRINKIVMKGFKSFGKRTELEFNSNFNCILGPNGSGKSNVIDAICFVLGKGSAKGLRANKSANLIYNGGKKKNPAKHGEVSIYFDNSKKTFPVDEDYLKLTRIIKHSGQSIYKINDKTRTRQEVVDILHTANIDPDGYNIVLQGDISRLIEMSPLERRKIAEDIAGISVYEDKKTKAMNELSKADEKINQAEIILSERENYLKELKKERDQALKYKEIQDKLEKAKGTLCSLRLKSKKSKKEEIEKKISELDQKIKGTQEKIDTEKKKVNEKKGEVNKLSKEIEEKGEKEQVKIMKDIEQLKIDIATNKTHIGSNENELNRVISRKDQLQKSLAEQNNKIEEMHKEKQKYEKEIEQNKKQAEHIEQKIKKFREKHKLDDSQQLETDIEEIEKNIEDKQREIQKLREEQQEYFRENDKIDMYINSVDEKIAKVKEVEKKHKQDLEELKKKREEFKKTTKELNTLLTEDSNIASQLGNARKKLNDARDKLSKLEAKNSSIKQKMADNIAAKTIIESKNKFGEVYGTVSDLGEVESKYSTALSTAAGPRIKSIVVDTDITASKCIKHLKEKKVGTATFLPLNKIKTPDSKKLPDVKNVNGVHGFAIDLISFKPKFKKAFSYVFGNTIVVEDINVARRVGVGSIRMVTLDGDLVELSGAMHGGYRQKQSNVGFQEKELSSEIKENEKEVKDMEDLISSLEQKKADNEQRIMNLREHKSTLEGEIIKTEKSLHLDSGDLEANKKEKKELSEKKKEIDKSLRELQNKITTQNKELAELKTKKQQLRDKIAQLKNPTVVAELNTFEQQKTQLREKSIKLESDVNNIEMQLKNILEPERENITKILSQIEKEEKKFSDELERLKEKIKKQQQELSEKEKKQKEFYGKYKELFVKKDKLNEEIQKLENSIVKKEEQIRGFEQRQNTHSVEKAGIDSELYALEEEFKKYKDIELYKSKSEEDLKRDVSNLEKQIANAGNVNMRALEVYDKINEEYQQLLQKRDKLNQERQEIIGMINEIETKKKDVFLNTFDKINESFRDMFQHLSAKGEAFLELEDPENPFEGGLRIKVRITGKKFLDIRSLSGGEKTLTALAFIFSILEFEPASFYVFDEVDAALDKKNSELLANLIKKYSDKAQYVIISHKDAVISEAETLYGVSMNEDTVSKVVTLRI